jgi:hypothetical protein
MAGLTGIFFDTSVLIAGTIDFGHSSQHALLLMDVVADGRIERPLTAWHCCLEFYSVTTRLPEEYASSRRPKTVATSLLCYATVSAYWSAPSWSTRSGADFPPVGPRA